MWDLPRPGLEPMSPALAGGFLTTAPPGKSEMARSDSHLAIFPTLTPPSTVFPRHEVVTVFRVKAVFHGTSGTPLGLEVNQPAIGFYEVPIERLLPIPREASEGCASGVADDALPVALLFFRSGRVSLRPGFPCTSGTVVAAPLGAAGHHGERAGPKGGEGSGSGCVSAVAAAQVYVASPPGPRSPRIAASTAAPNSRRPGPACSFNTALTRAWHRGHA